MTGTPAAAIVAAVEPVETSSTPAACNALASSTRPVLSYTLISARRSGRRVPGACGSATAARGLAWGMGVSRVGMACARTQCVDPGTQANGAPVTNLRPLPGG